MSLCSLKWTSWKHSQGLTSLISYWITLFLTKFNLNYSFIRLMRQTSGCFRLGPKMRQMVSCPAILGMSARHTIVCANTHVHPDLLVRKVRGYLEGPSIWREQYLASLREHRRTQRWRSRVRSAGENQNLSVTSGVTYSWCLHQKHTTTWTCACVHVYVRGGGWHNGISN